MTDRKQPDPTGTTADSPRWGKIPAWWLDHPELDADGLAVLAALATHADRQGRCWPSQTTLAGKLKRSRSWVGKIVARLAATGILAVEDRWSATGGRLSCLYVLDFGDAPAGSGSGATPAAVHRDAPAHRPGTPAAAGATPCHDGRQEQDPEQIPDSRSARAQAGATVPPDWTPDADDLAWAQARFPGLDLAGHAERFVLRCQAHGYRYRDVAAAWRAWLAEDAASGFGTGTGAGGAVARAASPSRRPAAGVPDPGARVDAWMAAALAARNTPRPFRRT